MNKTQRVVIWGFRVAILLLGIWLIPVLVAQQVPPPCSPDFPGIVKIYLYTAPLIVLYAAVLAGLTRVLGKWEISVWVVFIWGGPWLLAIPHPPVEIIYTRADLAVPPEVAASYETLMRYPKGAEELPEFMLSTELLELAGTWTNFTMLQQEQIETAWQEMEAGRAYIENLDRFSGITDWVEGSPFGYEMPICSWHFIRDVFRTYSLYAMLQAQSGNTMGGLEQLSDIYSVSRKNLPYSNCLVTKMIFTAVSKQSLETAYHIISNTACSQEQLQFIKQRFLPLDAEHTSMRRVVIFEFLAMQMAIETAWADIEQEPFSLSTKISYDYNQTLSLFQSLCSLLLEHSERSEFGVILDPKLDYSSHHESIWYYIALYPKNLIGQKFFSIGTPSYSRAGQKLIRTKIYSDLLALEVHRQLDEELSLSDPYSEKSYLYDEPNHRFFSVGTDGIPHTSDDIFIQ